MLQETLEYYIWSFGELSSQEEEDYLTVIVNRSEYNSSLAPSLVALISLCQVVRYQMSADVQKFSRKYGGDSDKVSLRDMTRCVKLFGWFLGATAKTDSPFSYSGHTAEDVALILSIAVSYIFRYYIELELNNRLDEIKRRQLIAELSASPKNRLFNEKTFWGCLEACQKQLLACFILPDDIFGNQVYEVF